MIFDPILDIFRGKAVTVPPMDGALKPNTCRSCATAGSTAISSLRHQDCSQGIFIGNQVVLMSAPRSRQQRHRRHRTSAPP